MPRCVPDEHLPVLRKAKQLLSTYTDMEELIRLGAYRKGSDPGVDEAIRRFDPMETFLNQGKDESTSLEEGYFQLANLLEMTPD